MARTTRQSSFLNGVPELLLLQLLSRREMYGYELVEAIYEWSGKTLEFAEGVIYPVLHSLEREGLLKARRRSSAGRTRVYYSITRKGKRRLDQRTAQWRRVVEGVEAVLGGRGGEPRMA